MDSLDKLRIRQLDEALSSFEPVKARPLPLGGWLKTVREALGMSIRELAARTSMSKTAVANAENTEANGTIQMNTLATLADGLECDLVYALVPRGSLTSVLEGQARKRAIQLIRRASESMELEDQSVSESETAAQFEELVQRLLEERPRGFWNVQ